MARRVHVVLTVVAVGVCMGLAGVAMLGGTAMAQPAVGPAPNGAAAMRARMAQARTARVQARLDQAAARLEIRASQEPAWNAFAAAVKAYFGAQPGAAAGPGRAANQQTANQQEDAAALLHRLAAADLTRAQNLQKVADATTRLQAALDPNQREVLNQVVRMQLRRRPGGFGFPQRRVIFRGPGLGFGPPAAGRQFVYRSFGPGRAPGPGPDAQPAPDAPPPGAGPP